jgi:hypothetical protein
MIDEHFDRTYQQGRVHLNGGIYDGFARFARALDDSFKVLHRIEWNAPWESKSNRQQCH